MEAKIDAGSEPTILNSAIKTTNSLVKNPNTVTSGQGGTILQFICKSSLPKFQQAFGKTVYQNNTESAESPTTVVESSNTNNTAETKKATVTTKTVPVNVQPIQGSVIYSRQVPVGQTISLIPPGTTTRQVFRIATSSHEQLSLVKDSVIHTKMSALLAAALQGRPKNADGEIQVNCEEVKSVTGRPTLVQGARIVKPVQLQLPANVVKANPQPHLSSTTLEQLREFDMVYKQIKERSNPSTSETSTNSGESQEITPQRISVTYVNQLQKYTQLSPVVVVTTYNNLQPVASPALSVTSQGSSSPCVTPASTPTMPKIVTKSSKGKTLKTSPNNNTAAAKSSPIPKPQQKPQEDEHTTQRIFDILAEYAEQLRNSPDLNNKPAPRRRSNPPTNPSQNSKRKKSSGVKKSGQSTTTIDLDGDDLTIGSEDSSGGVVQLSVTDDEQSQASASVATESTDNASPPSSRPLIIAESGPCNNQSRNLIIADSSVGEALKMPNTAVIVPGSYIMPVSMVKGGQQIAVVSGSSKILATVPARSGQNMLLFQSFTNQTRKTAIPAVKYSTIQPISGITSQTLAGVSQQPMILPSNSVATAVSFGQPLTLKKIGDDREGNELLLTISQRKEDIKERSEIPQPDSSTSVSSDSVDIKLEDSASQSDSSNEKIFHTYQKTVINSVETSVIATTSSTVKNEGSVSNPSGNATPATTEARTVERMQSVLVTACSSNGPMLSHTTPRYRKVSEAARPHTSELPVTKGDFLHNGQKPSGDQKNIRTNTTYYVNKTKKILVESQKMDSEMQKKAAMERELRLQKSLSEECEDLGVDEPSASDLFPEADLLFDSNHSPSYDQAPHDVVKRVGDVKEEVKESLNLFSDDETSSSLRTDLFEYVEYDEPVGTSLEYQERELNGNIAESGSSGCEDNTLLPKCAAMSEVTLNSPISPEIYQEVNTHNKYKFKYSNRKKGERMKQSEFTGEVVTSSEDTIVCTQLNKVHCVEESYKILHIGKTELLKEGEKCELHCDEDVDSPSGRGARRSVRKLCSCCNGSQDGTLAKKRPHTSRPHTPAAPHKKSFLAKKR
ncbi:unnamed protein product [Diabrotica balteata]|uniref:Uncharacterized protein n=1 Tax=Diabrotica balteata TaxID=107213 RepID=A0A9N9SPQ1_DIABA|nr:unnamed protein product [Diabrotica balteata]